MNITNNAFPKNCSRHYGDNGTITGYLRRNPLVYPRKDGSRTYLFELCPVSPAENSTKAPQWKFVRMNAYVPASGVKQSIFGKLRKGSLVTAAYVVERDTYYNAEGRLDEKTYLRVSQLDLLDRSGGAALSSAASEQGAPPQGRKTTLQDRPLLGQRLPLPEGEILPLRQDGCNFERNKKGESA